MPDAEGLSLPAGIARRLLANARRELPNESCALLSGDRLTGSVRTLHQARNALASPYRFEVDPDDLVRIVHAVERRGDDLVAIFHSHPGASAVPSARDIRESAYPVVHLIAGMSGGVVLRAWRIDGTDASEVPLVVEGSGAGQSKALRRNAAAWSRRAQEPGQ